MRWKFQPSVAITIFSAITLYFTGPSIMLCQSVISPEDLIFIGPSVGKSLKKATVSDSTTSSRKTINDVELLANDHLVEEINQLIARIPKRTILFLSKDIETSCQSGTPSTFYAKIAKVADAWKIKMHITPGSLPRSSRSSPQSRRTKPIAELCPLAPTRHEQQTSLAIKSMKKTSRPRTIHIIRWHLLLSLAASSKWISRALP
jgi:hypothetical protein